MSPVCHRVHIHLPVGVKRCYGVILTHAEMVLGVSSLNRQSIAIFQSLAPYNDIEDFSKFVQSEMTIPAELRILLPNVNEVIGNQHLKVIPDVFPV